MKKNKNIEWMKENKHHTQVTAKPESLHGMAQG